MYLSELRINNFRKFQELTIKFKSGINILIGPNNAGKTAVIDALRALLYSQEERVIRFDPLDINKFSKASSFSFEYIFEGLNEEEEADFLPALVFSSNEDTFKAIFKVEYTLSDRKDYLKCRRTCGTFYGNSITNEIQENIRTVYLEPLRDVIQSFHPNKYSKQAKLLNILCDTDEKYNIESTLQSQTKELNQLDLLSKARKHLNEQHQKMLGNVFAQNLDLSICANDFAQISALLSISADQFDIEHNGLGYSNLIYMATVLSELAKRSETLYKSVIIEEPEAHLHPQVQIALLRYLIGLQTDPKEIKQIFITSHSPNFVCKSDINTLIWLKNDIHGKSLAVPIGDIQIDEKLKKKLIRYLDVTRSEIFFAQKILFVEGIAESLIVRQLAKMAGIDLDQLGVSVISVEGLNFDIFIPLFKKNYLGIPIAILTDNDPPANEYPTATEIVENKNKKSLIHDEPNIQTFLAQKTFEYDLALNERNIPTLVKAFKNIHPNSATGLEKELKEANPEKQAEAFFSYVFEKRSTKKGEFAYSLMEELENDKDFQMPKYIEKALNFLKGN